MRILVVNVGSSTVKLEVVGDDDARLVSRELSTAHPEPELVDDFLADVGVVDAVGHRVVHGGPGRTGPALVDDALLDELDRLSTLAPLHNPPAVAMIREVRRLRPDLPAVACFDTAFHHTLPPAASTYALPSEWNDRFELRRYGFHGLSHAYASRRAAEVLGRPVEELRLVTAHLGSGASLAAVVGGRSVDTTMGFTPVSGLVMATRPGDVDPGLITWLTRYGGLSVEDVDEALLRRSGLTGLAGTSDMREALAAEGRGEEAGRLAVGVYLHRLRDRVAGMAAAAGGIDALVFTGGVGERSAPIRARAVEGLGWLGLAIDLERNAQGVDGNDDDVSPAGAVGPRVVVVHAREDAEIAREVRQLLA